MRAPVSRNRPTRLHRRRCPGFAVLLTVSTAGRDIANVAVAASASLRDPVVLGVVAALASPFLSSVGVIFWDEHWRGSAFWLNLVKCSVATLFFLVAAVVSGSFVALPSVSAHAVGALCASSLIGIVVGDNLWLSSLKLLGARRVILIDYLKPFVGAVAGHFMLGETLSPSALPGMACAVAGVLIVALEAEGRKDVAPSGHRQPRALVRGYVLAAITTILDVGGSALTKRFGVGMGPLLIGGLRFGFAAACMGLAVLAHRSAAATGRFFTADGEHEGNLQASAQKSPRWHEMPVLSHYAWARVAAGAVFITFLSPALSVRALFALPFSVCLMLSSLGPLYAIPLGWLLRRERVSRQAMVGSLLAVFGMLSVCHCIAS